jgi:hypothetical protein
MARPSVLPIAVARESCCIKRTDFAGHDLRMSFTIGKM